MFAAVRSNVLAVIIGFAILLGMIFAFITASRRNATNKIHTKDEGKRSGSFMGRRLETALASTPEFTELCSDCFCPGAELVRDFILVGGGWASSPESSYLNMPVVHSADECYEVVRKDRRCGHYFYYSRSKAGNEVCGCRLPCASKCQPQQYTEEMKAESKAAFISYFAIGEDAAEKDDATCFSAPGRCMDTLDYSREVRGVKRAALQEDPNSTNAKLVYSGEKRVRYSGPGQYQWHDVPSKPLRREACHNVKELGFCNTTDGRAGCQETCGRCERPEGNEKSLARQEAKKNARVEAREAERAERESGRKSFRKVLHEKIDEFYQKLDALMGTWKSDRIRESKGNISITFEFLYKQCFKVGDDCGYYYYHKRDLDGFEYTDGHLQLRKDSTCAVEDGKHICRFEFNECYWIKEGGRGICMRRASKAENWIEMVIEDNVTAQWIKHDSRQVTFTSGSDTLTYELPREVTLTPYWRPSGEKQEEKRRKRGEAYEKWIEKRLRSEWEQNGWDREEARGR